jgi:hypothetical protein
LKEGTKLANILQQQLGWHATRTQFAAAFVLALLRLRTVNFPSLALCLNPHAKRASNERRLQRFFAGFKLDSDTFAKLLFTLTPASGPLVVTLDRTHWQVGRVDVNVLLFAIAHRGVAFPTVWKLLGKPGNSNQAERKALLERLLKVIAQSRIKAVVADREFIGEGWFETLEQAGVPFVIRIRKNAKVTSRGRTKSAGAWPERLAVGVVVSRRRRVKVYGHKLFLTSLRGNEDDVIILSNRAFPEALAIYSERWAIEPLIQNLKRRGFDIEATRLRDDARLERLLALLALAFVFAYRVGEWLAERVPITLKRHGRKEKSVFRLGLDYLRELSFNSHHRCAEFETCLRTLLRV